jgi:putative transposase
LTIKQQCELLGIHRSAYYYSPIRSEDQKDMTILQAIIEVLQEIPFYGYRKIAFELQKDGLDVTRKQIRRIMHQAGLRAIYPGKRTSMPNKEHTVFPYLLRGKQIWLPNQVWATDITYIKLKGSFVYLTAIMDLYSRKVLTWKVSNTMDAAFCVAALEEAISKYGVPAIFNTDQGSQFTSNSFVSVLKSHKIAISMDGIKRAIDNIYVERLWRTVKYEEIYINDYSNMEELKASLERYFKFYNEQRFHQSLEYMTPEVMYNQVFNQSTIEKMAA